LSRQAAGIAGRVILLELPLRNWYNKATLIEGKLVWFGEVVVRPAFEGRCRVSFTAVLLEDARRFFDGRNE